MTKETAAAGLKSAQEHHSTEITHLKALRSRLEVLSENRDSGVAGDFTVDIATVFADIRAVKSEIEEQEAIVQQATAILRQAEAAEAKDRHHKLVAAVGRKDKKIEGKAQEIEESIRGLIAAAEDFEVARDARMVEAQAARRAGENAGLKPVGATDTPHLPLGRTWDTKVRPIIADISNYIALRDSQ